MKLTRPLSILRVLLAVLLLGGTGTALAQDADGDLIDDVDEVACGSDPDDHTSRCPGFCNLPRIDVWDSTDPLNFVLVGQIETIRTAQTGKQHYDYFSVSSHAFDVNLAPRNANLWMHESTIDFDLTFGFTFAEDESPIDVYHSEINFRVVGSDTNPFVAQSDDPGEATESPAGSNAYVGVFNYFNNTDGIAVSGISGDFCVIVDSVDFGSEILNWFAANGSVVGFGDDLGLTLGNEYRLTEACTAPCDEPVIFVCDPNPRSQGYWHRQCLGVPSGEGGIDPGRNGRGPQEPLEEGFKKVLMPAIDIELQNLLADFQGTCGSIDAEPASDPSEKGLKQFTALLLNRETNKIQDSCNIDLTVEGCSSGTISDLVDEIAALLNSGDPANCQIAASCAGAINEGGGFESSAATSETVESTAPAASVLGGSRTGDDWVLENMERDAMETELTEVEVIPFDISIPDVAPARPQEERTAAADDAPQSLQGHMAVLANASAPERARSVSTDALLTALSGGFELEQRLAIVRALIGNVDVAYDSLLREHLWDIEAEARAFDREGLAQEATGLLERLEPSDR